MHYLSIGFLFYIYVLGMLIFFSRTLISALSGISLANVLTSVLGPVCPRHTRAQLCH